MSPQLMPPVHPDTLYQALLARPSRSERREFLPKFQAILARHHESGSTEFTIARVSKLCEAAGIVRGRVLYNAQSADYRALIEAWALFSNVQGLQISPELKKNNSKESTFQAPPKTDKKGAKYVSSNLPPKILLILEENLLLKSDRDSYRIKATLLEAEKKLLENKLEALKMEYITPARQPRGRPLKTATTWELKPVDVDALKKSIAPKFFKDHGWMMGSRGEVLDSEGEIVYEAGYVQAIRKLLANAT